MSPIDPAKQLSFYLRGQLAALQRTAPADAAGAQRADIPQRTAPVPQLRPSGQPRQHIGGAEDLASAMARRLATIGAADPDRRRKAFRVFLESVLLDEWGPQIINDPAFHQLVDQVQAQMASDNGLQALMEQAADRLLTVSPTQPLR